jgi:hypothetical protein
MRRKWASSYGNRLLPDEKIGPVSPVPLHEGAVTKSEKRGWSVPAPLIFRFGSMSLPSSSSCAPSPCLGVYVVRNVLGYCTVTGNAPSSSTCISNTAPFIRGEVPDDFTFIPNRQRTACKIDATPSANIGPSWNGIIREGASCYFYFNSLTIDATTSEGWREENSK